MDQAEQMFAKWRDWVKSLLRSFQDVIIFRQIANGFEASMKSYEGQSPYWNNIVGWIAINYAANMASSIRRLSDTDKQALSLRGLLESMKKNAFLITPENCAKYCKHVRIEGPPDKIIVEALDCDIELIRIHTKSVHDFVDKYIAHYDLKCHTIRLPSHHEFDVAIDTLHKVYRKWAWFLADDMPCNIENPDPNELLPEDVPDFEPQFTLMWKALTDTRSPEVSP
jgi:hypothetical protein